jgi:hypothetical protein
MFESPAAGNPCFSSILCIPLIMYTVMAANNDAVPPRVLKPVAVVDTVVRCWYWSSSVWIYILAYVLYTFPFFTCTPNIFEIGYIFALCMFEFLILYLLLLLFVLPCILPRIAQFKQSLNQNIVL